MPGSRTLDSVPDDDGDDDEDSEAKRNVTAVVAIVGFAVAFILTDAVLFESLIQPLAARVDPTLAADPEYANDANYWNPVNGAARLKDLSLFVCCTLGLLTGGQLAESALEDSSVED